MFYDSKKIRSYNALFNFILGDRGFGKTFNLKKYCAEVCANKGREFIYLRRYKTEINSNKMSTFFNDLNALNGNNDFSCKNGIFYYKEKQRIGMSLPLSTYISNKSIVLDKVDYIIFDEFIIDTGAYHYLNKEVETFMEFYFTISRFDTKGEMRPVKVFFLANAISSVNPYFSYFDIKIPLGFKGIKRISEEIVLEVGSNEEYINKIMNTKQGRLIARTKYGDYAFGSNFLRDTNEFIESKSANAKYYFTIKYMDNCYGVYIDYKANKMFITESYDDTFKVRYSFTTEDLQPNTLYMKKHKNDGVIRQFRYAIDNGLIRFENQKIKAMVYEINQFF